jgi:hypothetical protein
MNELENLIVSGKELDQKLVAEVLAPYVRLDKETCKMRPLASWNTLRSRPKILLYLLSRKAMVALGFELAQEGATAGEVIEDTGLKKGTVHPALRALLLDDRFIDQDKDGRYFIPNYAIERVKAMLSEE